ncbi:MAG TPA: WD40 repeat domain-containing protein [Acidimicrobiales bacterium]|nr:WD40 repeat domain-containing protein [Acidimicrobiales bacterium]
MQAAARRRSRRRVVVLPALAVLLAGGAAVGLNKGSGPSSVVPARSLASSGTVYFTTFSPPTVSEVRYRYRSGSLSLGRPRLVARTPGADGLAFAPDGRLLLGGQGTGDVISVSLPGGQLQSIPSGVPGAFHVSVDPSGRAAWTSGEPGRLAKVPLDPLAPGRPVTLHGSDTAVTALAFAPDGKVLYTSSPPDGVGDIGLVDLATGTTTRLETGVVGAHGAAYDPFTNCFLVVGGDTILQLDAADPSTVVSELAEPGTQLDQVSVTGRGQAFVASNNGELLFVDYSRTGRVGDVSSKVTTRYVTADLDDVAPLVGPGAKPVPTDAPAWRTAGEASLGAEALLVAGLVAWLLRRARKGRSRATLPSWDRRRRGRRL